MPKRKLTKWGERIAKNDPTREAIQIGKVEKPVKEVVEKPVKKAVKKK